MQNLITMEREELLEKVNAELGETKLTLSEQTINEELDAELEMFGDDATANAALVTKLANRLKRLDGNLHADVSAQVKAYKQRMRGQQPSKSTGASSTSSQSGGQGATGGSGDDTVAAIAELRAQIQEMKDEDAKRTAAATRSALLKEVEEGLKAKFEESGVSLRSYFVKNVMRDLDVPEKDADVNALISSAEKAYNAALKEADVPVGQPRFGASGNGGGGGKTVASDYFARKARKEGWGKQEEK